jgi:hypothetical protein
MLIINENHIVILYPKENKKEIKRKNKTIENTTNIQETISNPPIHSKFNIYVQIHTYINLNIIII